MFRDLEGRVQRPHNTTRAPQAPLLERGCIDVCDWQDPIESITRWFRDQLLGWILLFSWSGSHPAYHGRARDVSSEHAGLSVSGILRRKDIMLAMGPGFCKAVVSLTGLRA